MKRRLVVLQHVAWEGPGIISREAQRRDWEVEIRRLDRGDNLPDADHLDGLVIMGGPMGAYQEDRHPFLRNECDLLAIVARRGDPVLGVCLGAQLLAKSLGAVVFHGHGEEIGFGTVALTSDGQNDPLFAGTAEPLPVFHWHGDTFTLPEGAVLLASSSMYTNQAFRFGSQAYGLQFHLEPDAASWADWRPHLPMGMLDRTETQKSAIESAGNRVVARFFDHVTGLAD